MVSADSLCSLFNLNDKNVNTLTAQELLGLICTHSLTMKFSMPHSAMPCAGLKLSFIVSDVVQVNPDNSLTECVNL